MATEIASAYIKLIPSTDGIKQSLTKELGASGEAAGSAASKAIGSRLSGALKTVGVAAGAAVTAAATGFAALGKEATSLYANYEQLKGGAELLFGGAYDYIAEKAKNAYNTVQMSQNDYLEQANGFAVGLKTALGGNEQAAAELADRILTAEADVVAATGNSQEAVQNAFNGIMKSNYTMLDNLQLGITPTKEGMQEVIDKVNEWNTANGEATAYQIGNLADVQSALVDYIEMQGLSGYAAGEAAATIQGSVASMKSAWENLLTGMADGEQDSGMLVNQLVQSVLTVKDNLAPMLQELLPSLADGLTQLITALTPYAGETVQQLLPSLLEGATGLISGLVTALPDVVSALIEALPPVLSALITIAAEQLPTLVTTIINAVSDVLPTLTTSLVDGIIRIAESLTAPETLISFVEAGLDLLLSLAQGIADALPQLVAAVPVILSNLVTAFAGAMPLLVPAAIEIISTLANGLLAALPELGATMPNIILGIVQGLLDNLPTLILAAPNIIIALATGLVNAIPELVAVIPRLIMSVVETFTSYDWGSVGRNIVDGVKNGFVAMWENFKSAVSSMVNSLIGGVKSLLGIASPSKVFAGIGGYMAEGMEEGILGGSAGVQRAMQLMTSGAVSEARQLTGAASVRTTGGYTPVSYTAGGGLKTLEQIAAAVDALSGKLERLQVVLDDGTLVGVMAPGMDRALGRRTAAAARGY